jgi:hypothetical protein
MAQIPSINDASNASTLVQKETSLFQNNQEEVVEPNSVETNNTLEENIDPQQNNQIDLPLEQNEILEQTSSKYLYESVDFDDSLIQSKQLYAKFLDFPTTVFAHQRVAVKIEALITTQEYTHIQTRFINSNSVAVINPQESWKTVGNNKLNNEFFLKIYNNDFELPTFQLVLYHYDEIIDVVNLPLQKVRHTNISSNDEEFSNVIAQTLDVTMLNARQYSNEEILVVLQLEALNGNLEDFRLKAYEEQFLMSLDESYPKQVLTFNVIVPIYTKSIKFKYYNTQKEQFETLSAAVKLDEQLISTQTDLNPNNNNMELYKKVAVGIAAMVFILIYILRRHPFYIIIAIAFSAVFFYFAKPNDSLVIHQGTNIYILPTPNSTVFHVTQTKQLVEILNTKGSYFKILFKFEDQNTRTVGWIKEKDIVEN